MEPVRLIAVVSVVLLTWSSLLVLTAFRDSLPPPVWRVGVAQSVALGTAAVGVITNALSTSPLTPGAYVAAAGFTVSMVVVVRLALSVVRRQPRSDP